MTTRRHITRLCAGLHVAVLLAAGCAADPTPTTQIVVPSAATSAPEYRGDGSVPAQRYVVRMSDGRRDWEVEFPEVATGYELRIPLREGEVASRQDAVVWEGQQLTGADKELLRQLRRDRPEMEREGVFVDGRNVNDPEGRNELGGFEPGAELDADGRGQDPGPMSLQGDAEADAAPTRPSYLLGIDEVQKLFRGGNYELAMVRLVQLEQAYPGDAKLLSMKGTLWVKLGRPELAREAWERVLQIDPDNRGVLEGLKRLNRTEP